VAEGRQESLLNLYHTGHVDDSRNDVVRRLAHIDMIVRVDL
jgi:hypothetical protein